MKQVGIRISSQEYREIKNMGFIASEISIVPMELNDSDLFSLLINYAWKERRQMSEIIGTWTMDAREYPLDVLARAPRKGIRKISKSLVVSDETYGTLREASGFNAERNMSEAARMLCLSTARDPEAVAGLIAWILVFESAVLSGKAQMSREDIEDLVNVRISSRKINVDNLSYILYKISGMDFNVARSGAFEQAEPGNLAADMQSYIKKRKDAGSTDLRSDLEARARTMLIPHILARKMLSAVVVLSAMKRASGSGDAFHGIMDLITELTITGAPTPEEIYGLMHGSVKECMERCTSAIP